MSLTNLACWVVSAIFLLNSAGRKFRASCADAALGLETVLGKTVTLGRDHICEETLLTHSIDICWDVLVLNNCISEAVKNRRKGWEAERLSCS